jgi:hypothetical protein
MTSTDLIQQMTKKCRNLAAVARNADDRAFWLGLAERWKVVESRSTQQHCLRQGPLVDQPQKHSPGRGGKAAGAKSSGTEEGHAQSVRLRRFGGPYKPRSPTAMWKTRHNTRRLHADFE